MVLVLVSVLVLSVVVSVDGIILVKVTVVTTDVSTTVLTEMTVVLMSDNEVIVMVLVADGTSVVKLSV